MGLKKPIKSKWSLCIFVKCRFIYWFVNYIMNVISSKVSYSIKKSFGHAWFARSRNDRMTLKWYHGEISTLRICHCGDSGAHTCPLIWNSKNPLSVWRCWMSGSNRMPDAYRAVRCASEYNPYCLHVCSILFSHTRHTIVDRFTKRKRIF